MKCFGCGKEIVAGEQYCKVMGKESYCSLDCFSKFSDTPVTVDEVKCDHVEPSPYVAGLSIAGVNVTISDPLTGAQIKTFSTSGTEVVEPKNEDIDLDKAAKTMESMQSESPLLFVLKLDESYGDITPELKYRLDSKWSQMFDGKPPAPLMVVAPGCDFQMLERPKPLPGKYAYHYKAGSIEETFTFQTHKEMEEHIRSMQNKMPSGDVGGENKEATTYWIMLHQLVEFWNISRNGNFKDMKDFEVVLLATMERAKELRREFGKSVGRCDRHFLADPSKPSSWDTVRCSLNLGHDGECSADRSNP